MSRGEAFPHEDSSRGGDSAAMKCESRDIYDKSRTCSLEKGHKGFHIWIGPHFTVSWGGKS